MGLPETIDSPTTAWIPTVETAAVDSSTTTPAVIREEILTDLGEGTHHESSELPVTGTPLPDVHALGTAIQDLQDYLGTVGGIVLAKAHLDGIAAPVHTADSGTMYAYIDEDLLRGIITDVVTTREIVQQDDVDELCEAVMFAHEMEFRVSMNAADIDPEENASYAVGAGKQTETVTPVVFATPHPINALDDHPMLPERGLGLTAGIQQLAVDLGDVYSQRDVGMKYLVSYLNAHGVAGHHSRAIVSTWYDVTGECLSAVLQAVSKDIDSDGLPARNPEFEYYLTSEAHTELTQ